MKHDLTTGTWQDDTGCPISIVLAATSDAAGAVGQRWMVVGTQLFAAMCLPLPSLFSALPLRLAHVMESASTSLHLAFHQGGTLATCQTQANTHPITTSL